MTMKTEIAITDIMSQTAKLLASLPNSVTMSDARAIAFADTSSALELCAIYLADFLTTNDKTAARKYLPMCTRVSESVTALAGFRGREAKLVGEALLMTQRALVEAHKHFQAHVEALLTASRATVRA
jgi:hypothetical protein